MNGYLDRHYTGAEVDAIIARVRDAERDAEKVRSFPKFLIGVALGVAVAYLIWG